MKKEYSDQEIYDIDKKFQDAVKKQEREAKEFFYKLLCGVLILMLIAAFIGYICA